MHVLKSSPRVAGLPGFDQRLKVFKSEFFRGIKGASACVLAIAFLTAMVGGSVMAQTAQFVGSQWRPVRIDETSVPRDSPAFIRFETEDRLVGHGGCNRFFGTYKIAEHELSFSAVNSTRMACPALIMDQEAALFDALGKARSFERTGTELRLFDANNREVALLDQVD